LFLNLKLLPLLVAGVLQEVPEAVRIVPQDDSSSPSLDVSKQQVSTTSSRTSENQQNQTTFRKSLLAKSRSTGAVFDGTLTSAEAQQVRTQPLPLTDFEEEAMEFLNKEDPNSTLIDFIKSRKKQYNVVSSSGSDEGTTQKQQILEELHVSCNTSKLPRRSLQRSVFSGLNVNFMGSNLLIATYFNMQFLKISVLLLLIIHCLIC
jgi:hypothetical protein